MNTTESKVPVTVLTGFLGAGKTTLLNRILTEQHGKKIAVIENEFGEVGVDNELVIGADEEIFEMNNGCICCTVRGDLIRILGNLMKRKDKLDYILIETTGLADPAPVAQTFFVDEDMQEKYQIDGIVTLVDARHVLQHIDDSDECKQQIAFADVILLNKIDLVSAEELRSLENKIRSMNSQARIHHTQNAGIGIDHLLNIKAFDLDAKVEVNPEFMKEELPFEYAGIYELNAYEYYMHLQEGPDETMDLLFIRLDNETPEVFEKARKRAIIDFSADPELRKPGSFLKVKHSLNRLLIGKGESTYRFKTDKPGRYALFTQHHPEEFAMQLTQQENPVYPIEDFAYEASHEHDNTVSSVGIDEKGDVDLKKFNAWISALLQTKGVDIFRMKGIVSVKGHAERFVFQGVHMLFDAQADRQWQPGEQRRNQLVFIGRNLDREALNKGFKACLVK
jgi:G3E family GTPase